MILKLLLAPITAPIAGVQFVLRQVGNVAEQELFSPERIREELLLLQLKLDEGTITEDEYKEQEQEIILRLRDARERVRRTNG